MPEDLDVPEDLDMPEDLDTMMDLQEGSFYCVLSNTEQGFSIVQCDAVIETGFAGVILEKCLNESVDKLFYRHSQHAKVFDTNEILYMLISVRIGVTSKQKNNNKYCMFLAINQQNQP